MHHVTSHTRLLGWFRYIQDVLDIRFMKNSIRFRHVCSQGVMILGNSLILSAHPFCSSPFSCALDSTVIQFLNLCTLLAPCLSLSLFFYHSATCLIAPRLIVIFFVHSSAHPARCIEPSQFAWMRVPYTYGHGRWVSTSLAALSLVHASFDAVERLLKSNILQPLTGTDKHASMSFSLFLLDHIISCRVDLDTIQDRLDFVAGKSTMLPTFSCS